jgi:hypothetical protein
MHAHAHPHPHPHTDRTNVPVDERPRARTSLTRRSALVSLAADTIFIDLVIFSMDLTDLSRIETAGFEWVGFIECGAVSD